MMGLNNFSKNVSYAAMGLALMMGASSAQAVIITQPNGAQYEITLVSHVGTAWTYHVKEIAGKSLSHWVLGIDTCIPKIGSHSEPSGTHYSVVAGPDGDPTTGTIGVKWDTDESFTEGDFTIVLDQNYQEIDVAIATKAGNHNAGGKAYGTIIGPDCNNPDNDGDPDNEPLAISLSNLEIQGNTVKWSTDLEHNNAGYHVWVRCPRVTAAGPGNYEFKLKDCTAVKGIVLEDIDNAGRSSFHMDLIALD
jgi:hypothetical protein